MAVATASAGAVAALPGGQALAAIVNEINGDAGAIGDIGNNWQQAASSGAQHTTAVNNAVAELSAEWKGTAAEGFSNLMQLFADASSRVQEPLLAGGQAMNAASQAIKTAQDQIEAICQQVLSKAGKIRAQAQGNHMKAAQVNSQLRQLTAQAASKARAVADEANSALEQLSQTLSTALSKVGINTFAALPAPSAVGATLVSTAGPASPADPPVPVGGTGVTLASAGGPAPSGGVPAGGETPVAAVTGVASGGMVQNAQTIFDYLKSNGYSAFAAAGIVACIYGESALNPEAVGTGGWGLIGWTPQYPGEYQSLYPTGNDTADLDKQLPALLQYNKGWSQYLPMLNSATSVQQAADIYSQYFERPAVLDSDVHAAGLAIARQISGLT